MTRKLGLFRLGSHEFNRAVRAMRRHYTVREMVEMLFDQRTRQLRSTVRAMGFALVTTLWLGNSANGVANVDLTYIKIAFPAAFLNLAAALSFMAIFSSGISYFVIGEYLRLAMNRAFGFDNLGALSAFYDGDNWMSSVQSQHRFFRSGRAHGMLGNIALLWACLPFLIVVFYIFGQLFLSSVSFVWSGENFIDRVLRVSSVFLILFGPLFLIVHAFDFTFVKNTTYIRWNFLYPIYKRTGYYPDHVNRWLDEAESTNDK